jgi:hypothetical protein
MDASVDKVVRDVEVYFPEGADTVALTMGEK